MLGGLIPIAVGVFAVVAAACDWDWFFARLTRQCPVRLFLSERIVRPILRFIVAALGGAVAVIASMTFTEVSDNMARTPDEHKSADCRIMLEDSRLEGVTDKLCLLLRNGIRILATEATRDIPIGQSKLGGCPDLPAGVSWPTVKIEIPTPTEAFLRSEPDLPRLPPDGIVSLPFVAQINLSEARESDIDGKLPGSGMLFFFYNPDGYPSDTGNKASVENMLTGFRYDFYGWNNPGNWRVLYHSGDSIDLRRRDFPPNIPDRLRFRANTVAFRLEKVLPCLETTYIGDAGDRRGDLVLDPSQWRAYADLRYDLRANIELHQMLGYADQYASTTDQASYCKWRSELFPDLPDWTTLNDRERSSELHRIRVLLQLEVFDGRADRYGRNGSLFFFIRDSDLVDQRFDRVWAAVE